MTTPDSPCSVPEWLRVIIPLETPAQQQACRWHDLEYERGGDRAARLRADLIFARLLLSAGMGPDLVEHYYQAVRDYGGPRWTGGDKPGARPLRPSEPEPQAP